jgi:hypothetical protein
MLVATLLHNYFGKTIALLYGVRTQLGNFLKLQMRVYEI